MFIANSQSEGFLGRFLNDATFEFLEALEAIGMFSPTKLLRDLGVRMLMLCEQKQMAAQVAKITTDVNGLVGTTNYGHDKVMHFEIEYST